MGFTEALTLIFIVLKLTHNIDWSWWWVLSPELIAIGIYVVAFILTVTGVAVVGRFARRGLKR